MDKRSFLEWELYKAGFRASSLGDFREGSHPDAPILPWREAEGAELFSGLESVAVEGFRGPVGLGWRQSARKVF